jgi:putative hemolysin
MNAIGFELSIILVLLIVNGVFAMSELAIVAAKRVRLERLAERGDAGARAALALASAPDDFLSTVQVGITLVGVVASAYGGATMADQLALRLADVAWIGHHAEPIALGIVVAIVTYLSVVIGELVPKRIALGNPERVAAIVARPMALVARAGRPIVRLLTGSTKIVLRLFGIRGLPAPGLTEEEIHAVIEQGAESGVVPRVEHEIVESVFRLGDRHVTAILTPRLDVAWIDVTATATEVGAFVAQHRKSWLLVCDESVETIVGVASSDEILSRCLTGLPFDLRGVLSDPLYVPTRTLAFSLLETFRTSRQRVAVVVDEYGGMEGVVSFDDLVEELLGGMQTVSHVEMPSIASQADGTWVADGTAPVEDIEEALDVGMMAHEAPRGYHTLAGFLMSRLGRIPTPNDSVEWQGYRLVVETMDGRRVERVRIQKMAGNAV